MNRPANHTRIGVNVKLSCWVSPASPGLLQEQERMSQSAKAFEAAPRLQVVTVIGDNSP
jgi:hypothetical protein